MALVVLGSRRVTRDFDFVVAQPRRGVSSGCWTCSTISGLELASRVNVDGDVVATIDNRRVAAVRASHRRAVERVLLQPGTGLRIDLLFDFPHAGGDPGESRVANQGPILDPARGLRGRSAAPQADRPRPAILARRRGGHRLSRSPSAQAALSNGAGCRPSRGSPRAPARRFVASTTMESAQVAPDTPICSARPAARTRKAGGSARETRAPARRERGGTGGRGRVARHSPDTGAGRNTAGRRSAMGARQGRWPPYQIADEPVQGGGKGVSWHHLGHADRRHAGGRARHRPPGAASARLRAGANPPVRLVRDAHGDRSVVGDVSLVMTVESPSTTNTSRSLFGPASPRGRRWSRCSRVAVPRTCCRGAASSPSGARGDCGLALAQGSLAVVHAGTGTFPLAPAVRAVAARRLLDDVPRGAAQR